MKPAPSDPPEIEARLWEGIGLIGMSEGALAATPNLVAWYVGGNTGQSLPELTNRFHHTVVFEPAEECQPYLQDWCRRNPFANVTVVQCAVSDTDGEIILAAVPDKISTGQLVTYGTHGMEWDPSGPGVRDRVVAARRIDTLVEEYPAPDFILVDVEGHEMRVLQGGEQTITDYTPQMLVEFHTPQLHTAVEDCLHGHDYADVATIRHPHYPARSRMWHQHGWVKARYR